MVRFERTVRIKPGKIAEAFQWANDIANYINGKFPDGNDLLVFNQVFGDYGTVAWAIDVPDIASMDAMIQQLTGDQEYWAVVNKGIDVTVEASVHDTLWQQVQI